MAEELQAEIPDGRVVKAFNLNRACTWGTEKIVFDGYPLSIPIAGDDRAAKTVVAELVTGIGCTPIDFGGLEGHLEPGSVRSRAGPAAARGMRPVRGPGADG
ncbi:hypothetical protein [Streptomyces plumbiresistens]